MHPTSANESTNVINTFKTVVKRFCNFCISRPDSADTVRPMKLRSKVLARPMVPQVKRPCTPNGNACPIVLHVQTTHTLTIRLTRNPTCPNRWGLHERCRFIGGWRSEAIHNHSSHNQLNDYLEQQCQSLFDCFSSDERNKLTTVSTIAEINPKRTIRKGEKAICIEMADLSTKGSFPSRCHIKPYNGGVKFKNGDTIMARITPCLENGKTGYINFLDENQVAFGSTEYIVMTSKSALPSEYFYFLARNSEFVDYAISHMNGSSGRQRVSGADIEKYKVRIPSQKQLAKFKQIVIPSMQYIRSNSIENNHLLMCRDTILTRLLSGDFDISMIDVI